MKKHTNHEYLRIIELQKKKNLWYSLNPLPNDKMLDWFKFKAFEDDKISVT